MSMFYTLIKRLEANMEPLLLKREKVAELLGISVSFLNKIRENKQLNFPKPVYFSENTGNINTSPFWKMNEIKDWVSNFHGLKEE